LCNATPENLDKYREVVKDSNETQEQIVITVRKRRNQMLSVRTTSATSFRKTIGKCEKQAKN